MSKLDITCLASGNYVAASVTPRFRPSSVVYWSRLGLAIAAALICFLLRFRGFAGVAVAVLTYLASSIFYQYVMGYGDEKLKGKYRTISLGSGTFAFVWASLWILLFTVSPY
ncbi:MAG: hypothetical protein V1857_07080 [archaeon]